MTLLLRDSASRGFMRTQKTLSAAGRADMNPTKPSALLAGSGVASSAPKEILRFAAEVLGVGAAKVRRERARVFSRCIARCATP